MNARQLEAFIEVLFAVVVLGLVLGEVAFFFMLLRGMK